MEMMWFIGRRPGIGTGFKKCAMNHQCVSEYFQLATLKLNFDLNTMAVWNIPPSIPQQTWKR